MPTMTSAALGIKGAAGVLGAVGKYAGPLLNFAGNLFGGGGDRSNLDRHFIARRVRDAKEAGVHPLYALGAGGGYQPVVSTGSAVGDALRSTGSLFQNIRAEDSAKAAAGISDRLAEAQIRAMDAAANRDEVSAQVALSDLAYRAQSFRAQQHDAIGTRLDAVMAARPDAFGLADKPPVRATRRVVLDNGDVVRIADQDIMETGELLGGATTLGAIDDWLMSKVTEMQAAGVAKVQGKARSLWERAKSIAERVSRDISKSRKAEAARRRKQLRR